MTAILVVGSGRFDAVAVQPVVQPFFVARVAGLPTRVVNALRASRTMSLIAAIDDIDARLREQRGAVAELLFNAIGSVADKRLRNRLVQLRRDIFNGRAPRANDVASATDVLDYGGRAGLASLTNLVGRHGMLVDELRQTYGEELRDARLRFQAALEDEDFRRGLLVSSPTLSRNLMKYVALPSGTFGAREEQIERGLLRYFHAHGDEGNAVRDIVRRRSGSTGQRPRWRMARFRGALCRRSAKQARLHSPEQESLSRALDSSKEPSYGAVCAPRRAQPHAHH